MDPIPKSGYYNSNRFALIVLKAFEDIMGRNGVNAILNLAHLPQFIDHFPPDNLERQFDFADFSAINAALEEMYGSRGGRGLALRAGVATFDDALRNFGALAGVGDLAFKVLPLEIKLRIGLPAMAKIFTQGSDQQCTVEELEHDFLFRIHRCPICWGRTGLDRPVCNIFTGLLQGSLKWVSGGLDFKVTELRCIAMGDSSCDFLIPKTPTSE